MKINAVLLLVVIGAICMVAIGPVSAAEATLTFRDLSITGYQQFHVYEVDGLGTHDLGLYNSTTEALTLDTGSNVSRQYILQFVPAQTDYVAKPLMALTSFTDYTSGHYPDIIVLLFMGLLGAVCIALARRA